MRNKIERFLRGETWLHLVTMFFIEIIIIKIVLVIRPEINFYLFLVPPILLGFGKEFLDKKEGKKISLTDIVGTILGGVIAILIQYL